MCNTFNPHGARTADGVLITPGLRVYDNSVDLGTVERDDTNSCCGQHPDSGQRTIDGYVYTDHTVECPDGYCRHDHWFIVVLDYIPDAPQHSGNRHGGYRSMNGERLCTVHPTSRRKAPAREVSA